MRKKTIKGKNITKEEQGLREKRKKGRKNKSLGILL